jgi:hypothetical protein
MNYLVLLAVLASSCVWNISCKAMECNVLAVQEGCTSRQQTTIEETYKRRCRDFDAEMQKERETTMIRCMDYSRTVHQRAFKEGLLLGSVITTALFYLGIKAVNQSALEK